MAGINDKTFFGDDATFVGSGAGAQDVIQITPDTAIGAVAWKGIDISGGTLDPSATGATITGTGIDLSGVSLANDPIMNALHIQMPATFSGAEEKHCMLLEGFGSTIKICDGDDDRAITTDGEIHIDFDATGLAAGQFATVYDAAINIGTATDGHVHTFDVTSSGSGSVEVIAVSTHPGVDVIHQHIGTSGAIDQGWIELGAGGFTDSTAAFNAAGTDLPIFVNNTDLIYIGMTASFDHIDVILDTFASKDLRPDFAYSTGAGFTAFIPSDETNGFQQNGPIFWDDTSLAGFAARVVNASANLFYIRITRDRAGALTNPIEDTIQTLSATEFEWDKDGNIEVNSALVGVSNTGATNTITLQNPSDTASSSSQHLISVGGTSSGDPWVQLTVGTARSYSIGIDNTDSDIFKMTTDSDATVDPSSGTEFFTHNPATPRITCLDGIVTLDGDLTDTTVITAAKARSGALVTQTFGNSSATAAANDASIQILSIGAGSTGDTFFRLATSAAQWQFGQDFSDSGAFVINKGVSDVLDQPTFQKITAVGEVTFPLTPAFLATHSAAQDNVTGDSTIVTVNQTTVIFDQNSDYDGTNTFTAPVSGRYRFSCSIRLTEVGAAHTLGLLQFLTSNRQYETVFANYAAIRDSANQVINGFTILADMDAADTCIIRARVDNGGKTVDLSAGVTTAWFAGELVA